MQLDLQVADDTAAYYERGAARWSEIIAADIPDIDLASETNLRPLPSPDCMYPDFIDDLYFCLFDGYIDGAGGPGGDVLGFASVLYTRTGNPKFAAVSYAKFDADNAAQFVALHGNGNGDGDGNPFQTVVDHEMGHGLGVGPLWDCPTVAFGNSPNANREFQQLSGCPFNAPTFGNGDTATGCAQ